MSAEVHNPSQVDIQAELNPKQVSVWYSQLSTSESYFEELENVGLGFEQAPTATPAPLVLPSETNNLLKEALGIPVNGEGQDNPFLSVSLSSTFGEEGGLFVNLPDGDDQIREVNLPVNDEFLSTFKKVLQEDQGARVEVVVSGGDVFPFIRGPEGSLTMVTGNHEAVTLTPNQEGNTHITPIRMGERLRVALEGLLSEEQEEKLKDLGEGSLTIAELGFLPNGGRKIHKLVLPEKGEDGGVEIVEWRRVVIPEEQRNGIINVRPGPTTSRSFDSATKVNQENFVLATEPEEVAIKQAEELGAVVSINEDGLASAESQDPKFPDPWYILVDQVTGEITGFVYSGVVETSIEDGAEVFRVEENIPTTEILGSPEAQNISLIKISEDPPRYILNIDGKAIEVKMQEFFNAGFVGTSGRMLEIKNPDLGIIPNPTAEDLSEKRTSRISHYVSGVVVGFSENTIMAISPNEPESFIEIPMLQVLLLTKSASGESILVRTNLPSSPSGGEEPQFLISGDGASGNQRIGWKELQNKLGVGTNIVIASFQLASVDELREIFTNRDGQCGDICRLVQAESEFFKGASNSLERLLSGQTSTGIQEVDVISGWFISRDLAREIADR